MPSQNQDALARDAFRASLVAQGAAQKILAELGHEGPLLEPSARLDPYPIQEGANHRSSRLIVYEITFCKPVRLLDSLKPRFGYDAPFLAKYFRAVVNMETKWSLRQGCFLWVPITSHWTVESNLDLIRRGWARFASTSDDDGDFEIVRFRGDGLD